MISGTVKTATEAKTNFVRKTWAFSVFEVLPVVLYREVKPFPIWFYLPLLDNDVFLHILVVLVVVISTSSRTSKTEFVCKSYRNFRIAVFLSLGGGG